MMAPAIVALTPLTAWISSQVDSTVKTAVKTLTA